ncbi:MAG: hypothetical protein ACPGQL_08990 [Thermoplasmatota archaeon]
MRVKRPWLTGSLLLAGGLGTVYASVQAESYLLLASGVLAAAAGLIMSGGSSDEATRGLAPGQPGRGRTITG